MNLKKKNVPYFILYEWTKFRYIISEGISKEMNRVWLCLRGKKIIVNQTLLSKLWYIGQICSIPKYTKKEYTILSGTGKIIQSPRHLVQLSIWTSGVDILDIETQLNSLKMKRIQRLLNPTNALWKNLTPYQFNLVLNYNQSLALFKEK